MKAGDVVIGVDVGGTHVRMGMVDSTQHLLASESRDSSLIDNAANGPALLLSLLEEKAAEWCRAPHRLAAFALGFPSTISRDRSTVLQTPNLRGFDNVPMVDLVSRRFGVPVVLEKDVVFLLAQDIEDLGLDPGGMILGVYFGTGIGNAIFMNGSFFAGKNGVAGELGHIPLHGGTRQCGCRNVGCIETEASGRRLAQIVAEAFPGEHIGSVFERHGNADIVASFLESLSVAPAVEINILDPHEVVVGGGITRMASFPRDAFLRRVLSHVRRPLPYEGLSIRFSSGSEYAGILGGARLAAKMLDTGAARP